MSLDRLFDTAFRRGCDISVEYAQRTPRYNELHINAKNVDVEDPEELALIQYLGERLADRAAQNLPIKIKHSLHLWDEGLESQHKLLEIVMKTLTSTNWHKYRVGRRLRKYSSADTVLPAQTKSWARGPLQPNCLGAVQMLVGMARQLGANHYVVNVLQTNDQRLLANEADIFKMMLDDLDAQKQQLPELRVLRRKIQGFYEKALLHLADLQHQDAHHALAIQMCDGSWMLVDPYLVVKHPLNLHTKRSRRLLARIDRDQRATLINYSLVPKAMREQSIKRIQALLNSFAASLTWLEDEVADHEFKTDRLMSTVVATAAHVAGLKPGIDTNSLKGKEKNLFYYMVNTLLYYSVVPPKYREEYLKARYKRSNKRQARFDLYLKAVFRDRVRFRRAYSRIPTGLAAEILNEHRWIRRRKEFHRHLSIELAHPATMLGCATLNHLRVRTGIYVHGRLSVYTKSQWVLLDTLAAERKGDTLDTESQKEVDKLLKHLGKLSGRVVLHSIAAINGSR